MGKNIVLGVTGGVSAYKAPDIVNGLLASGHDVLVAMTLNGTRFISPRCFKVRSVYDMWNCGMDIPHIELATWADVFVVAPATANIIGKFANGIADDLLSTNHLALSEYVIKIMYPTMNTRMLEHPAVQYNLRVLAYRGWDIQNPDFGMLQCGVQGEGKMPNPRDIVGHVNKLANGEKDEGKPMFRTVNPSHETMTEYIESQFSRIYYTETNFEKPAITN